MNIPIQNVYYLLCYAWDKLPESETVEVGREGFTELQDLFGHVLAEGVAHLLRRGLDRDYVPEREEVAGVRGKIDLTATMNRILQPQARAVCEFDELRHDVLHNRIVRSTLGNLLRIPDLDPEVRDRVSRVFRRLQGISTIRLTRKHFRSVQLHRNNRFYYFLLDVCAIVHANILIGEETGAFHFRDFRADEQQMGAVFERFIFNFFRREQQTYDVTRPHIGWNVSRAAETDLEHLPTMRTDAVLESTDRNLIIDAKFYSEPLKGRFGSKKIDSAHLYQIFAYVKNREAQEAGGEDVSGNGSAASAGNRWEGMLLYPVVDQPFTMSYVLSGNRIQVRSIELDQSWRGIHRDLLSIVN